MLRMPAGTKLPAVGTWCGFRRRPADLTCRGAYEKIYNPKWAAWVNRESPDELVPAVEHPEAFLVQVAAGLRAAPVGLFQRRETQSPFSIGHWKLVIGN